jgi:hypothetical protein
VPTFLWESILSWRIITSPLRIGKNFLLYIYIYIYIYILFYIYMCVRENHDHCMKINQNLELMTQEKSMSREYY